MSMVRISEERLTDIGNAIREKTKETIKYTPSEMANKIKNLSSESSDDNAPYVLTINNPSPNAQEVVIWRPMQTTATIQNGTYTIPSKPTVEFYIKTQTGYNHGKCNIESPYTFKTKNDVLILEKATSQTTTGELVSLDSYFIKLAKNTRDFSHEMNWLE